MLDPPQPELLPFETDAIGINARCLLKTQDGHRVVLVAGVPIVHYAFGDAMTEAYAMVQLVAQWADQNEVARGFDRSERSVRCYQRRFEGGGLAALARPGGYPAGRPRVARSRDRRVNQLRAEGKSLRQIAEAVGVSEKAIRKQLRRFGWPVAKPAQIELPISSSPSPAITPSPDQAAVANQVAQVLPPDPRDSMQRILTIALYSV